MEWLQMHYKDMWLILTTAVTLASLIVKLTPSKLDDKLVMKLMGLMSLAKKA